MSRWSVLIVLSLLLLTIAVARPVNAQEEDACPAIVKDALAATDEQCAATGRNEACYGYLILEAEPQPEVAGFVFEQSGDIVGVADVRVLRLSAMDVGAGTWGVALMRIQANLPGTAPGQNVTFLLFGDVMIENAGGAAPPGVTLAVSAAAAGNLNVRGGPSTNDAIVDTLSPGQTVTADGRLQDGSWLRIRLPEDEESAGWVFAQLVTSEGALNTLAVVEPGVEAPRFGPMQAFYFATGLGDAPCAEAPDSGLLIQVPEGAAEVVLLVNEVSITLGSTAFLQAQAGGEMTVNTLEGAARVTAFDVTQVAPAGTRVRVPLDENLAASGPPSPPEPYDEDALQQLPAGNLEREIPVVPALSEDEIASLQPRLVSNTLGDACQPGGVTASRATSDSDSVVAVTVGGTWTATAGVTATFVAGGDARLSPIPTITGYIRLIDASVVVESWTGVHPGEFATSGSSMTLAYTFTEDIEFTIYVSAGPASTVTLTVTCD